MLNRNNELIIAVWHPACRKVVLHVTMEDSLGLLFEIVNLFGGARNKIVPLSLGIKRAC